MLAQRPQVAGAGGVGQVFGAIAPAVAAGASAWVAGVEAAHVAPPEAAPAPALVAAAARHPEAPAPGQCALHAVLAGDVGFQGAKAAHGVGQATGARVEGPAEQLALLNAWTEVNVLRPKRAEQVIRRKFPLKKSGGESGGAQGSLQGFPFLFAGKSYRTHEPVERYMNDESLAQQLVAMAAHASQEMFAREKSRAKAEVERKRNKHKKR